jgi:phenylalanine-4-hydroxylase
MQPVFRHASPSQQDEVWRVLCARQGPLIELGMCRAFLAGARTLQLDPTRMPRQRDLSRRLFKSTGWRLESVPGLIPVEDFFALLRERRFPSPEWIRHPSDLEYTPEPDAFHDLFGHIPQLASPICVRVLEALAHAARGTSTVELAAIERVYWYTIEFGLVREDDGVRALGAGLASSIAELERALHAPGIERRAFELHAARNTPFFTDRPQELYLVTSSLAELATLLECMRVRAIGDVA